MSIPEELIIRKEAMELVSKVDPIKFFNGETTPYVEEKLIMLPFLLYLANSLHVENSAVKLIFKYCLFLKQYENRSLL